MDPVFAVPNRVYLRDTESLESSVVIHAYESNQEAPPLSDLPNAEAQQAAIFKDVLSALLGHEGYYIRYSDKYNANLIHDRLAGPDFKIAKHLDLSLKVVLKKLLRFGKFFSGLTAFVQIYNQTMFGAVNQHLCHEIRAVLEQYTAMIIQFDMASALNEAVPLTALDNELHNTCADEIQHLYEITSAVHSVTESRNPIFVTATSVSQCVHHNTLGRDTDFTTFLDSIKEGIDMLGSVGVSSDANKFEVCKGGLVLQVVERRKSQFQGDQEALRFLLKLLTAISTKYVQLLNQWLLTGVVEDPFLEFAIKKNELPKNIFYSNMERYWDERYVVKLDGLVNPLASQEMQSKVLSTGKFLNIYKQCVETSDLKNLPESLSSLQPPSAITNMYSPDFGIKVQQFYDRANKVLLKLFFQGYHLNSIVDNLHQTYCINDAYEIDNFLQDGLKDLGRDKSQSSTGNIITLFESHCLPKPEPETTLTTVQEILRRHQTFNIDANDFYNLAAEIINIKSINAEIAGLNDEKASNAIKRLVSESLQRPPSLISTSTVNSASPKDPLILGVNIDTTLPFPLNLVISENYVLEYQLIFKLQMLLKYTSKLIDATWKELNLSLAWTYKGYAQPIRKLILRARTLSSRMKSLINELESHFNHSVVEMNYEDLRRSFAEFQQTMNEAHRSDETPVLGAGTRFLTNRGGDKADIFDVKLRQSTKPTLSGHNKRHHDFHDLRSAISLYLNNILRDTMITDMSLLQCLRDTLLVVTDFTFTKSRLKKTLILMDQGLLEEYRLQFPGKFDDVDMSEELVSQRVRGLNGVVTKSWVDFNACLQSFTQQLGAVSAENPKYIALTERVHAV